MSFSKFFSNMLYILLPINCLFGITLLCMVICGDSAGLVPDCCLLCVVGSTAPSFSYLLGTTLQPWWWWLSASATPSMVSSSGSLFPLLCYFWYHGHRRGNSVLYLHVGFGSWFLNFSPCNMVAIKMNLMICNSACFNWWLQLFMLVCNSAGVQGSNGIKSKLYLIR
jgi:hypothetical protein